MVSFSILGPFGPRSTGDAPRRSFNTAQKKALEKEKRDLEKEAQKRIADEKAKEEAAEKERRLALGEDDSEDEVGGRCGNQLHDVCSTASSRVAWHTG